MLSSGQTSVYWRWDKKSGNRRNRYGGACRQTVALFECMRVRVLVGGVRAKGTSCMIDLLMEARGALEAANAGVRMCVRSALYVLGW